MKSVNFRNMFFLFFITFTFYANLDLLQMPLPLYLENLGGGPSTIGWLMGITGILTVIIRPFMGAWSDINGKKGILLLGMFTWFISPLLLLVRDSFLWIAMIRAFQGVGMAAVVLATQALMAEQVQRENRGKAIALQGIADGFAIIAAPLMGFWLVENLGFKWLFGVAAGLAIIGLILALFVVEQKSIGNEQKNVEKETWLNIVKKPVLFVPTLIGFGQAFSFGAILYFMAVFANQLGVSNIGYLYAFWGVFLIIGRYLVGKFSDKFGREVIVVPTILASAFGMFIIAMFSNDLAFYIGCAFIGLGYGGAHTGLLTFTIDNSSHRNRGFSISFFGSALDLGISLAGFTLGIIADFYSYNAAYYIAGIVVLLLGLLSWYYYTTSLKVNEVNVCERR